MYKKQLLNSIEKEINICRRLYTKIQPAQMNYRPKEGIRSTSELLQYLCVIVSAMPTYWLKKENTDFDSFYGSMIAASKEISQDDFITVMDKQLTTIKELFEQVSEEDLLHQEVAYPWGGTAPLGEGIIETSVKWAAAYKLQLFLFIKLSQDTNLGTADAWMHGM